MKIKQLEWKNVGGPWEYWYATNAVGNFSVIERYNADRQFDTVITIGDKQIVMQFSDVDSGKREAQVYFETAVLDLLEE